MRRFDGDANVLKVISRSGCDLLADALGDLWPALELFTGVRIVGLIHDEILREVPRSMVDEVKASPWSP